MASEGIPGSPPSSEDCGRSRPAWKEQEARAAMSGLVRLQRTQGVESSFAQHGKDMGCQGPAVALGSGQAVRLMSKRVLFHLHVRE